METREKIIQYASEISGMAQIMALYFENAEEYEKGNCFETTMWMMHDKAEELKALAEGIEE